MKSSSRKILQRGVGRDEEPGPLGLLLSNSSSALGEKAPLSSGCRGAEVGLALLGAAPTSQPSIAPRCSEGEWEA